MLTLTKYITDVMMPKYGRIKPRNVIPSQRPLDRPMLLNSEELCLAVLTRLRRPPAQPTYTAISKPSCKVIASPPVFSWGTVPR